MSVKPWDFLNPNQPRVSDKVFEERISLCETCPKWLSLTRQCKRCGCFMDAKARLAEAHCPLGRWDKSTYKSDTSETAEN